VGYAAARKLAEKFPGATIYLGTKNMDITPELNKKMRGDFPEHAEHCEYVCLDVSNKDNIAEVADMIRTRHETLDILVNNAGRYLVPDTDNFGAQAELILNTNFWGLKNMIEGIKSIITPGGRLVNVSSHLGHLSLINGEPRKSLLLRELLADRALPEARLDSLMREFQQLAKEGGWQKAGWPDCAYTVSKVAVNVYTRILQHQFDQDDTALVVNSIHPGTKHSLIHQASVVSMEDGAFALANAACVPDKGLKGEILWHNLNPIIWEDAVHKPSLINSAAQKIN
jgi:carbonyl reductase 1